MSVSPARVVACKVLLVLARDQGAFAAETIRLEGTKVGASDADLRLATAIVYSTLRNAYLLDYQYRPFLRQAPSRLTDEMRTLLRMAACQKHLLSRLPDHAIANETIELARKVLRMPPREVAFLNAIVRKITAMTEMRHPAPDESDFLRNRYSMPDWLLQLFGRKFGTEQLEPLLCALNEEPPITVRRNRRLTSDAELREAITRMGGTPEDGVLSPDAIVIRDLPLRALLDSELFARGAVYLQDEGSQVIAHLVDAQPGQRVLDLCAAPGGKATHIAELTDGKAEVVATDPSERRLQLMRQNLERLQTGGVEIRKYEDVLAEPDAVYDRVLVDAPCSGLGTLRRNPEIRYRCTAGQLERLADQQLDILQVAAQHVLPGGRLIYSTCTVSEEENAQVVGRFLEGHPEFTIFSAQDLSPAIEALRTDNGFYRTWPHHLTVDGFEAVVLARSDL